MDAFTWEYSEKYRNTNFTNEEYSLNEATTIFNVGLMEGDLQITRFRLKRLN